MSAPVRDDAVLSAAAALARARAGGATIAPISASHGIAGLAQAYAVAAVNTEARLAQGARIVGSKIGLTSLAVQQQLGVDQPDFGVLFDDMEYLDGDAIPAARLLQPKAEVEVAFIVGHTLAGHAPSWAEFVRAIDYALPAIEIVDSAITDWRIKLEDTVADNASCGLYVLGQQPVALGRTSLAEAGMQLYRNGKLVSTGSGAACLGHPLRAAYWLARTMAGLGRPLQAGQVVLSGALGPMVPVAAGDELHAIVDGLGHVGCHFI
ncbi:fumarylacetoacetate hydrolase family protein [Duganella sp. LX20W]|uniref:Fumarylacetoacetate hydrolase family protein n=1 Tax=Rugamonas brunnea TaxID=2758569 RepID=A0A7W2IAZ6_9BURK|nr:fumarylacetoacetate hydrolase family protein [Rugamonas brunnea]MBA5636402.1 fumarylacetoacetate hydrolase family protein [Rugamonas brunnea]